jgi:hypothetical protein
MLRFWNIPKLNITARMLVPKLVKNGFYSSFGRSGLIWAV